MLKQDMWGNALDDNGKPLRAEGDKGKRGGTTRHLKVNDQHVWIVDLIVLAGFAESNSEARRVIRQGGVKINEQVVHDEMVQVDLSDGAWLQVGPRLRAHVKYGSSVKV